MRTSKVVYILFLCLILLFSTASCVVLTKRDNGNHKGWFKNQKNPHNPYYMDTGKNKGNNKK